MKTIVLFLLLVFFSRASTYSQTALIASVEQTGSRQLVRGVQELYNSLNQLGWSVETLAGIQPTTSRQAQLEFFLAVSNENLDQTMRDFSIPSYEVSSAADSFSFILDKSDNKNRVFIVGSDWTGVMYGLFDLAKRVSIQQPSSADGFTISDENHSPVLQKRGTAVYLHTQALTDLYSWYHDDDYWVGLLKQLSLNRFNCLELRGAFDAFNGEFKNLYPYLVAEQALDEGLLDSYLKNRNLERLRSITDLASEYGIQVSLVNYQAMITNPSTGQQINAEAAGQFTRSAIQIILQQCPNLAGIGFQTGESGVDESFYRSNMIPVLNSSNRSLELTVHPWLSEEFQIRTMMNTYTGDSVLAFKFNGDHIVHPYPVSGHRMVEWHSYSYENYFSLPRDYKAVFQINSRGTNRIFPWMDTEFIRRTVQSCARFNADGIVIEAPSPYTPPFESHLHSVQQEMGFADWDYERDWYWYEAWGRLAYQPNLRDEEFSQSFARHFGGSPGQNLFQALLGISKVIPALAAVYYPSPDARSYAPEFEPPLSVFTWLEARPLDLLTVRSVQEEIAARVSQSLDAKRSPLQIISDAENAAKEAVQFSIQAGTTLRERIQQNQLQNGENIYREWQYLDANIKGLSALSTYLRTSLETALHFGMFQNSGDTPSLLIASETSKNIMRPWMEFQNQMRRVYSPVHDAVRMDEPYFHWADLEPSVQEDQQRMSQAYLAWQEGESWQRYLGHNRAFTAKPNEPFILTCSVPPGRDVQRLNIRYKNSFGQTGNVPMAPSTMEGVYAVEIDGELMTEGAFEYFIVAEVDGNLYKVPPDAEGSFYTVSVTPDTDAPSVLDTIQEISVGKDRVTVVGNFFDPSGIISAKLHWKGLPSDSVWNQMAMNLSGTDYIANFPLTANGVMYAIEIIDGVGNGVQVPNVEQGLPYFLIPAFGSEANVGEINQTTPAVQANQNN